MTLAQQVLDLIATPVNTVFAWFFSLFNSMGLLGFLTGTILFALICTVILIPLRGSGVDMSGGLKSVTRLVKADASEPKPREVIVHHRFYMKK